GPEKAFLADLSGHPQLSLAPAGADARGEADHPPARHARRLSRHADRVLAGGAVPAQRRGQLLADGAHEPAGRGRHRDKMIQSHSDQSNQRSTMNSVPQIKSYYETYWAAGKNTFSGARQGYAANFRRWMKAELSGLD